MEGMERIKTTSRRLGTVFRLGLLLTPALVAAFWVFVGENEVMQRQLPVSMDPDLPGLAKLWGFAVSMIPGLAFMFILAQLSRLFRLYEQGRFFTRANVAVFQRLGWSILAWAGATFLQTMGLGIVLTLHRPAGQRLLVVTLSSDEVLMALIGIVVLTISWVMDEARKIEEEQALIV